MSSAGQELHALLYPSLCTNGQTFWLSHSDKVTVIPLQVSWGSWCAGSSCGVLCASSLAPVLVKWGYIGDSRCIINAWSWC